jgi:hypothetical protein
MTRQFTATFLLLAACSQDLQLSEEKNKQPQAVINAPEDQGSFSALDSIEFLGTVADGDGLGDLQTVVWTSDQTGEIAVSEPDGEGVVRAASTLASGVHTITLSATDKAGVEATDNITVVVQAGSGIPIANITSPPNLSETPLGSTVALSGGVDDADSDLGDLTVTWTHAPADGGLSTTITTGSPAIGGTTTAYWEDATLGTHRIVLEVVDESGQTGTDEIVIEIVDPGDGDADGDGWSVNQGDCDDDDPAVHPYATELCDGKDNDCNLQIDDKDLDLDNHVDEDCTDYAGVLPADDCNDEAGDVHPGADEPMDGVDNDCDDDIDEGTDAWDDDGDCFCEGVTCTGSVEPSCLVLDGGDCDDTDPLRDPADRDADTFSTCEADCDDDDPALTPADLDGDTTSTCDGDCDDADPDRSGLDEDTDTYTTCDGDCDDGDLTIYPGAPEIPADGIDQDCDTVDDCWLDADLDGWGGPLTVAGDDLDCSVGPPGESAITGDCDDADPDVSGTDADIDGYTTCGGDCDDDDIDAYPGAPELVADGIDQDCDGVDSCWLDADDDDFGLATPIDGDDLDCTIGAFEAAVVGDCNDGVDTIYPGAPEVVADGVDQDCDLTDACYEDLDGDLFGTLVVIESSDMDCTDAGESGRSDDCDDTKPLVTPIDLDLDGYSGCDGDCDDTEPDIFPGAMEVPADGIDSDCDTFEDCYEDLDEDGYGSAIVVTGADMDCDDAREAVTGDDCDDFDPDRDPADRDGDAWSTCDGDCDDDEPAVHPTALELVADGVDQDCDDVDHCWEDGDLDGYGGPDASAGISLDCASAVGFAPFSDDCDDALPSVHPFAPEVVADGVDQDCDDVDDCYQDFDGDGIGSEIVITGDDLDCTGPLGESDRDDDCNDADPEAYPGRAEIAGDGTDQDCDDNDLCYVDADFDGWGGASTVVGLGLLCDRVGESSRTGDCDDSNPDLSPEDADEDGWSTCDGDCDDDAPLLSPADGDLDGWSGCDGDCDDDDITVHPDAADVPDPDFLDQDCDGMDGDGSESTFVAPSGSDSGDCLRATPCATIAYSAGRADALGKRDVLVQAGTYTGVVNLDGVTADIYGGYDTDWDRDDFAASGHTVRLVGALYGPDDEYIAVRLRNADVLFANLKIESPDAAHKRFADGKSSYGVHAVDSTLLAERIELEGGDGYAGTSGYGGTAATQSSANKGSNGANAETFETPCDTGRNPGGAGATNASCSNTGGGGGGDGGQMDTDCFWGVCTDCDATGGLNGANASIWTTSGYGYRGGGGGTCSAGGGGISGRIINGSPGSGAAGKGRLISDYWYGYGGSAGGYGEHGGGGGGGGGSGGCDPGTDDKGAGGGGGGAGGCRADPGGAGGAGGGSFLIFAVSSSLDVSSSTLTRGDGIDGATGGAAGAGQPGGASGSGGAASGETGKGGNGGAGGHGGHGGGGGGGGGGHSYAIYTLDSSVNQTGNIFGGGSAGDGGEGGNITHFYGDAADSEGGNGGDGTLGTVGTCASAGGC